MISIANGLKNSLIVLELIRDDEELREIPVDVGTFTNCRECGLTFKVSNKKKGDKFFTFCIYEHRNSDSIIINGKKGYIDIAGELPYMGNSSGHYIAHFSCGQYQECADKLTELIKEFYNE